MITFNQQLALKQQVAASGMKPVNLDMQKDKAMELYRAYKTHQAYQKPEDYEIMRTYKLIAQGQVVIQAIESVRSAGLNEQGLPKLAIMRAHQKECFVSVSPNGSAAFKPDRWSNWRNKRDRIELPSGSFARQTESREGQTILPIIPVHLRPKRGMENYHVLWEAEWRRLPPGDPFLLRQIGKGDMWLVVAAWDLTEVEKAAMRTRINAT